VRRIFHRFLIGDARQIPSWLHRFCSSERSSSSRMRSSLFLGESPRVSRNGGSPRVLLNTEGDGERGRERERESWGNMVNGLDINIIKYRNILTGASFPYSNCRARDSWIHETVICSPNSILFTPPSKKNIKTDFLKYIYIWPWTWFHLRKDLVHMPQFYIYIYTLVVYSKLMSCMIWGTHFRKNLRDAARQNWWPPNCWPRGMLLGAHHERKVKSIPGHSMSGHFWRVFVWFVQNLECFRNFSEISGCFLECFGMFRQTQNGWEAVEDFKCFWQRFRMIVILGECI